MILDVHVGEAMDIVDECGADPELWPDDYRDSLEALMDRNDAFRDYVETAKRIDDMLANWELDDEGASIDLDQLGDDPQDDDEDEDEEDYDDLPAGFGSAKPIGDRSAEDDDDDTIREMDLAALNDALQDMDAVFQNIIRVELEGEGDEKFNVFTRDYDVMPDLLPPQHTPIDPLDKHVAKTVGPLMKDLRRLIAARSQAKRLPGMRRGRLHGPNLHRILSGDDRVFFRKEIAPTLDTAIMLVVDCSGSMAGPRMKLAAETAYALGAVLSKLGIAFECLGFTSAMGKHLHPDTQTPQYIDEVREASQVRPVHRFQPIMMPKFKGFEERWLPHVQRRFAYVFNESGGAIAPGVGFGGTPEGCGNEFAARRLLQRKESRKIMITMTDGEPADYLYSHSDGKESVRHAANMVQAISAAGIDLIGIGIQHAGPKRYYPNSMVINSVGEMPLQLLGLLKKLLIGK